MQRPGSASHDSRLLELFILTKDCDIGPYTACFASVYGPMDPASQFL